MKENQIMDHRIFQETTRTVNLTHPQGPPKIKDEHQLREPLES